VRTVFPTSAGLDIARSSSDTMNISNELPAAESCTLLRHEALEGTYSRVHGWIGLLRLGAGNLCKRESGEDSGTWRIMGYSFRRHSVR